MFCALNIYKISIVYNLLLGKVSHADHLVMKFIAINEDKFEEFVKMQRSNNRKLKWQEQ